MFTKKAYTLEEAILYLEALEMLDMIYRVEKHGEYYDTDKGVTLYNVWLIEYEQNEFADEEPSAIEFEE